MKILKFRAWHTVDNKMLSAIDIFNRNGMFYEDQPDGTLCLNEIVDSFGTRQELVLMQFTGLKDKFGKEMYEGDIFNTKVNRYEVIWNNNLGLYDAKPLFYNEKSSIILSSILNNCFLMGNIFENPDLIKHES